MPWRPGTAVPSGVRFLFDFVLALANYFEYTSVQVGDRHGAWVDGWRLGAVQHDSFDRHIHMRYVRLSVASRPARIWIRSTYFAR
eukprot:5506156-Prymnesium_polylepis.1